MPDPKDEPESASQDEAKADAETPAEDAIAIEKPIEENDFNAQPQ